MNITHAICAFVIASACAFAQNASVVSVDKGDADKLKAKYEAYVKAKQEFESLRDQVSEKLRVVGADSPDAGNTFLGGGKRYRRGFEIGVEFTPDFRHIVPKQNVAVPAGSWWGSNCLTTTPAVGTLLPMLATSN